MKTKKYILKGLETVKPILYMNMLGLTWLLWEVLKRRKSTIW